MQAPKFSPGEPAIVQCQTMPQLNGMRVVVIRCVGLGIGNKSRAIGLGYEVIPHPPLGVWAESALRPLPPEELAGCFDANEVPRKNEVSA